MGENPTTAPANNLDYERLPQPELTDSPTENRKLVLGYIAKEFDRYIQHSLKNVDWTGEQPKPEGAPDINNPVDAFSLLVDELKTAKGDLAEGFKTIKRLVDEAQEKGLSFWDKEFQTSSEEAK